MPANTMVLRPLSRVGFRPFSRLVPHTPSRVGSLGTLVKREEERFLKDKLDKKDQFHERRAARWENMQKVAAHLAGLAGTSVVLGNQQGYRGPVRFLGLPLEVFVTVGGYAASLLLPQQVNPMARSFAQGVGDGAFAAFLNQWGRGHGREKRAREKLPPLMSGSMGAMPLAEDHGGSALPDS